MAEGLDLWRQDLGSGGYMVGTVKKKEESVTDIQTGPQNLIEC